MVYNNKANNKMKKSWKEGLNMNGFKKQGFYELIYKNQRFSFLQYIRKDVICNVSYITLKNVITGETLTFNKSEVRGLRVTGEEANAS